MTNDRVAYIVGSSSRDIGILGKTDRLERFGAFRTHPLAHILSVVLFQKFQSLALFLAPRVKLRHVVCIHIEVTMLFVKGFQFLQSLLPGCPWTFERRTNFPRETQLIQQVDAFRSHAAGSVVQSKTFVSVHEELLKVCPVWSVWYLRFLSLFLQATLVPLGVHPSAKFVVFGIVCWHLTVLKESNKPRAKQTIHPPDQKSIQRMSHETKGQKDIWVRARSFLQVQ